MMQCISAVCLLCLGAQAALGASDSLVLLQHSAGQPDEANRQPSLDAMKSMDLLDSKMNQAARDMAEKIQAAGDNFRNRMDTAAHSIAEKLDRLTEKKARKMADNIKPAGDTSGRRPDANVMNGNLFLKNLALATKYFDM